MSDPPGAIRLPPGWGRARLLAPDAPDREQSTGDVRAYDARGRMLAWSPAWDDPTTHACDAESFDTRVDWLSRHFASDCGVFLARWVCTETRAKLERRPAHEQLARVGLSRLPRAGIVVRDDDGGELLYVRDASAELHAAFGRRHRSR